MPKMLIGEIVQLIGYAFFGLIVSHFQLKKPLYFALGFVMAIAIPSMLAGFGVQGMKGMMQVDNVKYAAFRSLPITNGVWGLFHLFLAFLIYVKIKNSFSFGCTIDTFLVALGFAFVFLPMSFALGM